MQESARQKKDILSFLFSLYILVFSFLSFHFIFVFFFYSLFVFFSLLIFPRKRFFFYVIKDQRDLSAAGNLPSVVGGRGDKGGRVGHVAGVHEVARCDLESAEQRDDSELRRALQADLQQVHVGL